VGDNSDVRPPRPDEVWTGGVIGAGSGGRHSRGPLRKASLTLDGVFFDDGGFAGPDREGLWDRVVLDVEAHAALARMAREEGTFARKIFAAIETVTGPGSDRPPGPPPPPHAPTPETLPRVNEPNCGVCATSPGKENRQGPQNRRRRACPPHAYRLGGREPSALSQPLTSPTRSTVSGRAPLRIDHMCPATPHDMRARTTLMGPVPESLPCSPAR
jgi:hypothetical protein